MVNKKLFEFGYPVYPCVYREHLISGNLPYVIVGLSLCVQGTFDPLSQFIIVIRFIPVCTGNILALPIMISANPVYPCVYREHSLSSILNFPTDGLSLCVQGTSRVWVLNGSDTRFIPVCTGNIIHIEQLTIGDSVYPCVYREHTNYNILFYN